MAEEPPKRRLVVTEVTRGRNGGPGILALGLGAPRAAPAAVGVGRRGAAQPPPPPPPESSDEEEVQEEYVDEDGESSDDDFRNDPYGVKRAERKQKAAELKKWRENRKALELKDKSSERRQALIAGLSRTGVGSYTSSSHRGEAGERVVFEDAKLLYVKTSSETSKFEIYVFIVDDKDVVMWRTSDTNKEAKLLAPGFIVDFVGTVSDQSTDGGVNVTTVTGLKVLIVDGARVAPTPKPEKRKKGAEDGDDDDDDEPAAAAKKARVAEGDETDDG
ncbi:unnamed protein product [Pelagomonas calceolata]|uniref:Uncharacterized protein n=1 Tax=Pelagomonas calceolata TaxID=35677 RepID=A0A8J2SQ92_9STRA|nr:unnamed protein product [Pelagomonas calceolata]